jgi:5-methylthioadenosine/S-adenosylhomocysteine deaminase
MEKIDHVLHAKWVITCEEKNAVLEDHAVAIKDGKIDAILPSAAARTQYPAAKHQHYAGHAMLPGLINAHTHLGMQFYRGLADDLPLMRWLHDYIWPAEGRLLSPELVYDASLYAIAECIRSGVTYVNDMYFFMHDIARAVTLSGIRAHLSLHIMDIPNSWASGSEESIEKGLRFYEDYKHHDRIKISVTPHSTYTVSPQHLQRSKELADTYHLKLNIHLQESHGEMEQVKKLRHKRPLTLLNELGILSPDVLAIHMTQINQHDLEILADTRPHIVHCPESNMKLASGICPVKELMSIGLNVALGTDSAVSNNDLDMIGEMRSAAFLGKVSTLDPEALSAETTLKMATLHGAKALGMEHEIGSIKVGKAADLIAIDLDQLETQPCYHPVSQIVYGASRNQVTDVWVGGKQLLKNRELTTLDEKELLNQAKMWRTRIKKSV